MGKTTMIRKLLNKIGIFNAPASVERSRPAEQIVPRFTITNDEGDSYLTRYYLFRCKAFRIFLHHIHRSDEDRALHDHPWPFVSILLMGGGYHEHEFGKKTYHPPFSVSVRWDAGRPHRVELERDSQNREIPQWTLCIAGRNCREWGFHVTETMVKSLPVVGGPSAYAAEHYFVPHEVFIGHKFGDVPYEVVED